jgi:hypothetical protein
MLANQGDDLVFEAAFVESKIGKTGLTVVCSVYNPARTKVVDAQNATEVGGGLYTYTHSGANVASNGNWRAVFHTATTTVDSQDVFALIQVGRAGTPNLDAAITSRLASASYTAPPTASDVWSVSTRTLSSAGTAGVAAAVWAFGGRTLTSLTDLFGEIRTAVWGALKSAYAGATTMGGAMNAASAAGDPLLNPGGEYPDGTIGGEMDAVYRRVTAGPVRVVSAGPDEAGVITILPGDAYGPDHSNAISIPIPSAPSLTDATLNFTVDGMTFVPPVVPTVTGSGETRLAVVTLTAAQSAQCDGLSWRIPRPEDRVFWRVEAEWSEDSPLEPQTIAIGEIRRNPMDRR